MKNPTIKSVAIALGLASLAHSASADDYTVYILTGQSNALGTTALEGANPAVYNPGTHAADAVTALFWSNVNASNTVFPANLYGDSAGAITPLQIQQGDGAANPTFWGPEFGFARTLYDLDLEDGTQDDNVFIIKATRGGGGNTIWNKATFDVNNNTGHMWGHLRDTVDAGLTALTNQGHTFSVGGLMYIQGESNSGAEASIADTRLDQLTTNLRTHINTAYTGKADAMQLVIGEIAGSQSSSSRQTTTALQQQLADGNSLYSFVPTSDLPLKSDNIHFGKDEKLEIGRRLGRVMMGLEPFEVDDTLTIANPSFETGNATTAVGANPPAGWNPIGGGMFHSNAAPPNQSLNDFGGAYADDANGLDGEEMAFNTSTGGINGSGLAQTLGAPADDNVAFRLTVGVGDRNFYSRFSGVTLELRLADETVIASRFFDTGDVSPLFTNGGQTALGEVVDLAAMFRLGDIDNTQNLRVAIVAGGATSAGDGGNSFGQSIDIDNVRLESFLLADLDFDGDVDDADFGVAFAAFTGPDAGPSSNPDADLDFDGDVDDADFGIAFAAFTGPLVSAAIPEPGSAAVFGLAAVWVFHRRHY